MSVSKFVGGLVAMGLGAAAITMFAGAAPETKAEPAPVAAKTERPAGSACPKEPWPYGCQWREPPARRVLRSTRPL
jgi:hypothetical protein